MAKSTARKASGRTRKHELRRGQDRIIAGVCSGIAEYFDTDPAAIRILWAVLTVFTIIFPGILVYLIAWAVMPGPRK